VKFEIEVVIEQNRLIQKFPYGETNQEHCVHGIKLRWSCDKCEEFIDALDISEAKKQKLGELK
jgi:hypothetical protein